MKVIDKDPNLVVPNLIERDTVLCLDEDAVPTNHGVRRSAYLGLTFRDYRYHTYTVNIIGTQYRSDDPEDFIYSSPYKWGWESKTLLRLLSATYCRWKYDNQNYRVEYLVLERKEDLALAFDHIGQVPIQIQRQLSEVYDKIRMGLI